MIPVADLAVVSVAVSVVELTLVVEQEMAMAVETPEVVLEGGKEKIKPRIHTRTK